MLMTVTAGQKSGTGKLHWTCSGNTRDWRQRFLVFCYLEIDGWVHICRTGTVCSGVSLQILPSTVVF